jgi:N-acyl-D-amino-acid deacylase
MRALRTLLTTTILAAMLASCEQEPLPSADPSATLIRNVTIIDGSGTSGRAGAVRFLLDEIIEVGDLEALPGEVVIDGGGQVLAPGFIDTHSHADSELFEQPGALAAISQGITTVVIGQDGVSPFPLLDFRFKLLENPVAVNVASFSGHNTLRSHVMSDDFRRQATAPEISVMRQFLREDMQAGALGLSAGLEYDPGIYSSTDEVVDLGEIVAEFKGRYTSHIRSEDRWFEQALDEIIEIGRQAEVPVHVSHIKLAMKPLWGRAGDIMEKLDAARAGGVDITADIYPYTYWQSRMLVLLPERDISDRSQVELALSAIAPPEGIWFTRYDPQPAYVGQTLVEIARMRDSDPVTTFMDLIAASAALSDKTGTVADNIIGTSMHEDDIKALLAWPHSNVCSDGSLEDSHPRGAGAFPRVLGRYVREDGVMPLEKAVHKMTGLAAHHMGFDNRGVIRPGAVADLVLFDPDTVIDNATPGQPARLSTGILKVWVNGRLVFENGRHTLSRPGRFIARNTN